MFAEVTNAELWTHNLHQPLSVFQHHTKNKPEIWRCLHFFSAKCIHQVAKQPRLTKASTAHNNTVASGLVHHVNGILCFPDVSVTKNRNACNGLFQFSNLFPMSMTGIVLFCGARMQRNHGDSCIFGGFSGVEERGDVVVDTNAEFARNGHAKRCCRSHRCIHNCAS